jgi:hypothetical protein
MISGSMFNDLWSMFNDLPSTFNDPWSMFNDPWSMFNDLRSTFHDLRSTFHDRRAIFTGGSRGAIDAYPPVLGGDHLRVAHDAGSIAAPAHAVRKERYHPRVQHQQVEQRDQDHLVQTETSPGGSAQSGQLEPTHDDDAERKNQVGPARGCHD